jgi:cytoskeletal protein CcmA (bactofilin family)
MKLRSLQPKIWQRKSPNTLSSELFLHEPAKARGSIKVYDDFLLDATLKGDITSTSHLTIGPNAVVQGAATARSVYHQGNLQGSLSAEARLVIQGGSRLQHAKLQCDSLDVQPGSQLIDVTITTS